jgi:hypothetical protein
MQRIRYAAISLLRGAKEVSVPRARAFIDPLVKQQCVIARVVWRASGSPVSLFPSPHV